MLQISYLDTLIGFTSYLALGVWAVQGNGRSFWVFYPSFYCRTFLSIDL
jgi:hypothetical protein